jgi:ABC-type uncharacterized transport system substrate-binding protein
MRCRTRGDQDHQRRLAAAVWPRRDELVAISPDIILAHASTSVASLLQATRTVPIVFVNVVDPVGASASDC